MGAECSRCGRDIWEECDFCRLRDALVAIRDADPVEMALDPGLPSRIAAHVLEGGTHA